MNEDDGAQNTPVGVLRAAVRDLGSARGNQTAGLQLIPPGDGDPRRWTGGHPLPPEIRKLYAYAGGFSLYGDDYSWDPPSGGQALPGVFDQPVGIWEDGLGNSTAVDIGPETGAWGAVLFLCHDPAMVVVEAPDFSGWLQWLLDQCRKLPVTGKDESSLEEEAGVLTWARLDPRRERTLGPADALSPGDDAVLGAFLGRLPPGAVVFDLRAPQPGDFVDLEPFTPDVKYQRAGEGLLFAALPR